MRHLVRASVVVALAACQAPQGEETAQRAVTSADLPPIDPVGPERAADDALAATAGRNATAPALAFDGTNYLVVWADQRDATDSADSDIWGVRVSQSGAVLDATGIRIAARPGAQGNPAVVFDGTDFLVAWEDGKTSGGTEADIGAALVSTDGAVTALPAVAATASNEAAPALASNGSGALLAWTADGQVMAAAFDGAFGDPFAVTATPTAHADPAIAAAPSGAYLVAFTETVPATGADVRGQLVSAGALRGRAFDISAGAGAQTTAAAAFDGEHYRVVWSNNKNGIFIYGARVTQDGTVLDVHVESGRKVGGVVIDNATATEQQPSIDCTAAGCLVAWQDRRGGAATTDLYARVLPTTFAAGPDFAVSTAVLAQASVRVAAAGGAYLAVWQDGRAGSVTVAGARIDASGAVADPDGLALAAGNNQETGPAAARSGATLAVGWSDSRGAWGDDIEAVRFDAAGEPLDAAALGVAAATFRQSTPAAVGFGSALLYAWTDTRSGVDQDIYAGRLDAGTGAVLDPAGIAVATGAGNQFAPAVAASDTEALVVWQGSGSGFDVFGAIIDRSGAVAVPAFAISSVVGDQITPTVAYSAAAGQYVVAWIDARAGAGARELYAARVTAAGEVLDASGVLVATGTGSRFNPRIAASGATLLAVFEDNRNGNRDIYGARLSAGDALTVLDPSGLPISTEASKQTQPTVAATAQGFFVAWADPRAFATTKTDIWAQLVASSGALIGASFAISATPEDETAPSAIDASGTTALVSYRVQRDDLHTARVATRVVDTRPHLASIAVTPANASIPKGTTLPYSAVGTYSDGTTVDLTDIVAWTSSAPAVAIMAAATATGVGVGTSTVTAAYGPIAGAVTLTVTPAVLTSIAVTPPNVSLPRTIKQQYAATGTYSDGTTGDLTTQVTWRSSNAAVATITAAGLATVTGPGGTTIGATLGTVSGQTTLTGTTAAALSILVTPAVTTITHGQTVQLTATARFSDGSQVDVTSQATWSSSAPAAATVVGGLVTGVAPGTAIIRAQITLGSGSASVFVN